MLSRKQFLRFTFVLVVIAFITTGVFMSIRNNQDNIVNSVVSSIEKVMGVKCEETPVQEVYMEDDLLVTEVL